MKARGEGRTEDETVGWHHQLNGHEFEQALGAGILWIKENQISQVKEFSSFLCMGRFKSLGSLKSFPSYSAQLSGGSMLWFSHSEFLSAHHREWLQPNGCQVAGILLLSERGFHMHCVALFSLGTQLASCKTSLWVQKAKLKAKTKFRCFQILDLFFQN